MAHQSAMLAAQLQRGGGGDEASARFYKVAGPLNQEFDELLDAYTTEGDIQGVEITSSEVGEILDRIIAEAPRRSELADLEMRIGQAPTAEMVKQLYDEFASDYSITAADRDVAFKIYKFGRHGKPSVAQLGPDTPGRHQIPEALLQALPALSEAGLGEPDWEERHKALTGYGRMR